MGSQSGGGIPAKRRRHPGGPTARCDALPQAALVTGRALQHTSAIWPPFLACGVPAAKEGTLDSEPIWALFSVTFVADGSRWHGCHGGHARHTPCWSSDEAIPFRVPHASAPSFCSIIVGRNWACITGCQRCSFAVQLLQSRRTYWSAGHPGMEAQISGRPKAVQCAGRRAMEHRRGGSGSICHQLLTI